MRLRSGEPGSIKSCRKARPFQCLDLADDAIGFAG
jgi:hypothetical protein